MQKILSATGKNKILLLLLIAILLIGVGWFYRMPRENLQQEPQVIPEEIGWASVSLPHPRPLKEFVRTHIVSEGETPSQIAELYGIDLDTLFGSNPEVGDKIYPGNALLIFPGKGVVHVVEPGDTLWEIASIYGVEIEQIQSANAMDEWNIFPGEKLLIPGGKRIMRNGSFVARRAVERCIWPVNGEVSSLFGYRWGRLHSGIDIIEDIGAPVRAAWRGKITYVGWYGGYGETIVMEHQNGYSTLYGHLSDYAVDVGQIVKAGQIIGYVGSSGNSTGPHLHFEVRREGEAVNPLLVLP